MNFLSGKKILIYGSGDIAKKLIKELSEFQIVGVIDRVKFSGTLEGIPIIMWDEVYHETADVVIIASLPQNYRAIYERIMDRCIAYGMQIYGGNGQNLISYFGANLITASNVRFFNKNKQELIRLIDSHEAISFDLFDTLIMRKTLEPSDLFDIVSRRIEKKGIFIQNFKKIRREAELLSKGNNIYKIYDIIQHMLGLEKSIVISILQEEIQCEEEYIILREEMVNLMRMAYDKGKQVNIITNLYLPAEILKGILKKKGVIEYGQIYVSCDYGKSKGTGLFETYLNQVKAGTYLHIGDDEFEDVESAQRYGLDAYGIKSAYEMLKVTTLRKVLVEVHNCSEKGMLGLLIADLFNNPFALAGTGGVVKISNLRLFARCFVAPIVIFYMLNLLRILERTQGDFEGILFGARDGYLFKILYEKLCSNGKYEIISLPSWYFMTSRKLCFKVAMKNVDNIKVVFSYNEEGARKILTQLMENELNDQYSSVKYKNDYDYYMAYRDEIIRKSDITRDNYLKYITRNNIRKDGKYIFCELVSEGSVHYGLNQVFDNDLYGFYLYRIYRTPYPDTPFYSCYPMDVNRFIIRSNNNFLECILTSPEPSVIDMNEDGNPVFARERRSRKEIGIIEHIQQEIVDFFLEFMDEIYVKNEQIKMELSEILLDMHNEIILDGECKDIGSGELYDDLMERNVRV